MKEINAYIHRNRIADVVHALRIAGFKNICVVEIKGTLEALDAQEQEYSIEMGERVITAAKLELICRPQQVETAVHTIRENSSTAQKNAGWLTVKSVDLVVELVREEGLEPDEVD